MFLSEPIQIRLRKEDRKKIEKIVKFHKGEKFSSESHFVRCAIMRLIREEEQDMKEFELACSIKPLKRGAV